MKASAQWLAEFAAQALDALRNREHCRETTAERAAIYSQPREKHPYDPAQPDDLRDGLLAAARQRLGQAG